MYESGHRPRARSRPTADVEKRLAKCCYSAFLEVDMKWVKGVALVFVAVMTLAIVLSVRACTEINREIDRCDDQTSGSYIWDDAARRSECGR
jgi:hypothetical protein